MITTVHALSPQKRYLTFISHKLPMCKKWDLQAPDFGRSFYGDID